MNIEQLALICQLEARERGRNDAMAAAAIVGPPSSPRAIKKSFKVPHFFKREPSRKQEISAAMLPGHGR